MFLKTDGLAVDNSCLLPSSLRGVGLVAVRMDLHWDYDMGLLVNLVLRKENAPVILVL